MLQRFEAHEKKEKRSYNLRIIETPPLPLVFARTGRMLRECGKFDSRLADSLAIRRNLNKSTGVGSLRGKLLLKLLPSLKISIRNSRARNVNKMKKITLMIQAISNMFMTSVSTKNKSSIDIFKGFIKSFFEKQNTISLS